MAKTLLINGYFIDVKENINRFQCDKNWLLEFLNKEQNKVKVILNNL